MIIYWVFLLFCSPLPITTKVLLGSEAKTDAKIQIWSKFGIITFRVLEMEDGVVRFEHIDFRHVRDWLNTEFSDHGLEAFVVGGMGFGDDLLLSSLRSSTSQTCAVTEFLG